MVSRGEDKSISHQIETIKIDALPADGDVLVAVEYSTVNYKDGLCLGGKGGLVRNYPHIPGIDFSGEVVESKDPRYAPGDKVVLTGWRVGENRWGGYAEKARVKADMLVPLPDRLDTRQAMAVGTAGLTAMLAVMALEDQGLKDGPGLVTGAAGGVGSVATALLAKLVGAPINEVEEICENLAAEYIADGRGFILARVAGGYRFQTATEQAPYVERFVLDGQSARLSAAALETLAVIAYKQPVSRIRSPRSVASTSMP